MLTTIKGARRTAFSCVRFGMENSVYRSRFNDQDKKYSEYKALGEEKYYLFKVCGIIEKLAMYESPHKTKHKKDAILCQTLHPNSSFS